MVQLLVLVILAVCVVFGKVEHSVYVRGEASGEGPAIAPSDDCNDYDVRLVGGNDSHSGIVEACYSTDTNTSLWGPLCAFGLFAWTPGTAVTICGQLNFSTTDAVTIQYENVPGPYSYQVYCNNDNPPSTLGECVTDEHQPLCPRMIAGGVICQAPPECPEGDVRLVDGYSVDGRAVAGRLEVCVNGVWGTVCRLSQWTSVEAAVVCRQLGINATVPIGEGTLRYGMGSSSQPVHLENVYCSGEEDSVLQCNHEEIGCSHETDAGVICEAQPGSCRDGDIRLRDGIEGLSTVNGFVQVCFTGIWGTVCGVDGWDDVAASVACRQLGHEFGSTEIRPGQNASVQNLLAGVNCSGSEERVADCDNDGVGVVGVGCNRAYVTCIKNMSNTGPPTGNTTADSNTGIITGSVVGGVVLLLTVTAVVVTLVLCILRERTVRRKVEYNLENARQSITVPDYVEMQGRPPSNYLVPVTSRGSMDIYSEWREVLKGLLLDQSQLTLTESLGEGAFGRVYKGSMTDIEGNRTEVAIKTLKDISTPENIDDFVKESILMLGFDHPNVLKLLGVCFDTDDHLPLIVLPFMANGDLRSYLLSLRNPSVSITLTDFPMGCSMMTVLKMCLDVAQGMDYLSGSSFVHRDLAARNCMVSADLTVNIADFGLSRDVYSKDYYRMGTKTMLPVKWMAPESLNDNVFTVKSDVWSFGVVCWEVFSLGSTPYPGVDNHEIPDYIAGGRRLKQPRLCPLEIYDMMGLCWNADSNKRPHFSELVEILETVVKSQRNEQPNYVNLNNETTQNGHAIQHL